MNEKVLNALMQLFAIISTSDDEDIENLVHSSKGRIIVKQYLEQELNSELVEFYIKKFDEHLYIHNGRVSKKNGKRKRTAGNSVKLLRICSEINEELNQQQRFIVLVRIIEFIETNEKVNEQEIAFLETVSETFNIPKVKYELIRNFISSDEPIDHEKILQISSLEEGSYKASKHLYIKNLEKNISVLYLNTVKLYFLRYYGTNELSINAQVVPNNKIHVLTQGSNFKVPKSPNLYYSDITSYFLEDNNQVDFTFKISQVNHVFPNGRIGLHNISFSERNGNLVAIMGSSGSGKTTLLNILNGSQLPTEGRIELNGVNIHTQKDQIEGLIGHVSQDDLLFEELTVYQNLYYSAALSFKNLSKAELHKKVIDLLSTIGLTETKDLKVGSPLQKSISGGQRKRLNIAMELIREPSILFIDEPTSGLSSRDSERIIDLLKELALKGKLIFSVIHQPSSEIFRMFDRLLILDDGGYSIFYGNPVDAIVHFKTLTNHVNHKERECPACGNVNPEQIFNIIEAKVVDELGGLTDKRKVSPKEWQDKFINKKKKQSKASSKLPPIKAQSSIPNYFKQFLVFLTRDLRAKAANRQYVLITLLEAPVLAGIIAYFLRYYNNDDLNYSFYHNQNIPQYIFIAVIISIFLGLTVSAEEIIKDKKILKRETFMSLSWGSYLNSKVLIMAILSAIQSSLFIFIGNEILEIKGMFTEYWGVLFSTSFLACMIGLIISASFNSAKVIYIIIPIIIIPQLLFSGVIVKYDKLNPQFSKENSVPWVGNITMARWSYEALAVSQYIDNNFEKQFYNLRRDKQTFEWKINHLIPELESQLNLIAKYNKAENKSLIVEKAKNVLANEIAKEELLFNPDNFNCNSCVNQLKETEGLKKIDLKEIQSFLHTIEAYYRNELTKTKKRIEEEKLAIGVENYLALENAYANQSLEDVVTNSSEFNPYVIRDNQIIQKQDLIYQTPNKGMLQAHFYSSNKFISGKKIFTYYANLFVLWIFSLLFWIILLYKLPQKISQFYSKK